MKHKNLNFKNFAKRLIGHISWHLRNSRPSPAIIRLKLANIFSKNSLVEPSGNIVSLTTHAERTETVYLTIETIGRGNLRPSRIILWLDNPTVHANPPDSLKRLQKRGLEIRLSANFGPHTKYYPFLESESNLNYPLVTADDDVLYPKNWLDGLHNAYQSHGNVINCYRARVFGVSENSLTNFKGWSFCNSSKPSFQNFLEGVSGVIYPPEYLARLKAAGTGFMETCPRQDDVWLNVNAIRHGFKVRQIGENSILFPMIPNTQDTGLWVTNTGNSGDLQISNTFTETDINIIKSGCN